MLLLKQGKRKCDKRCYDAKHENCNCVCGGLNHQKGEREARNKTIELSEKYMEKGIVVPEKLRQQTMF